jgi:hypothetical protein
MLHSQQRVRQYINFQHLQNKQETKSNLIF